MNSEIYEKFKSRLTELGYCEYISSFNPLANPMQLWAEYEYAAPENLRPVIDLLFLGRTVPLDGIDEQLRECIPALSDEGIFSIDEGDVRTTGLTLQPMFGLWLFYQNPQVNPMMYYGEDSAALIMRQRPQPGKTCLDICSGPGIQALYAAAHGEKVTSMEINPFAAEIAKFNARFNNLSIDVRTGSLYNEVKGMRFDRITANPPLLPFAESIAYPFVGHGGSDGIKITREIIHGLPDALSENGFAQIIGTGIRTGAQPSFAQEFENFGRENGLDIMCTTVFTSDISRQSPVFNGLVLTAQMATGLENEYIADEYEKDLLRQGATHFIAFYLFIRRGKGGFYNMDMSKDNRTSFWYL